MSARGFLKVTESKLFLVLAILIANLISPFFDLYNIVIYVIVYYLLACVIVWASERLMLKKQPTSLKSTLETMKILTLLGGATSIAFGFVILDISFISFIDTGSPQIFDFISGYLLIFIGIGLVVLSKTIRTLEKSVFLRLFNHRKVQMDSKTIINLISALILSITMTLYAYKSIYFASIQGYVALLVLVTIFFVWFLFRIFK